MILPLCISALAVLLTLIVASVQDARSRTVYRATWYPAAVIGLVCAAVYWITTLPATVPALILSLLIAALMAAFSFFGLFGKADAIALILIAVAVPVSPFAVSLFPSVAVSALLNAGVLILAFACGCLVYNLIKGNRAPFALMCSGYPVSGSNLLNHHGFIAETVTETQNRIERTFRNPWSAVTALKAGSPLMIRTLREHQDTYQDEIRRYARCDRLWITAGIPLLIPLTLGFIGALLGISVADAILSLFL